MERSLSSSGARMADGLLTVAEVASMIRISNMTVYRLIKARQLPAVKVGKNYRIRMSDIDLYLNSRAVGGTDGG